jgi:hypothetical protein
MKENVSERGFVHLDPVRTDYGADVRIYESSAAMAPHIWLAVDQPPPKNGGEMAEAHAHAHMSLPQAEEIHAQLGHMIERTKKNWGIE